jgi:putative methionine-R-sulfoxide reductase with GAF domain
MTRAFFAGQKVPAMLPKAPLKLRTLSSIRTQIIVGFGLILGLTLVIVVVNFFALQTVRLGIEATVEEAGGVRELSQAIQNEFLLARQQEQLFLANWRGLGFEEASEQYVTINSFHVDRARKDLQDLEDLLAWTTSPQFTNVTDELAALSPALADYQEAFGASVERVQERSQAGGQETQLQETLADLEASVAQLDISDQMERLVVQISANEQAFFNTGEQQYVDQTRLLALQVKDLLNSSEDPGGAGSGTDGTSIVGKIDEHMVIFQELVLLENEIGINTAVAEEVTAEVAMLTDAIRQEGATSLEAAREDLQQATENSTRLSVVFGLLALTAGVLTAYLLARRILGPLTELTEAAREIGAGNLDYRVSIAGQDEFAALAAVFNQMTSQLHDLIGSLERLVAERTRALTTSFRVSRRLSTILDQDQLVSEVVEQVRSAFDYYHTHIYLFNEDNSELIMVGGTGNAGRAMLAAGHRIERSKGLVGRAAESQRPVVVSDVTRDPGWLPNPLLPNTRSEIAVPIVLGNEVLGVLDVQHDIRGGLTRADAELLQSIANQVAIALHNAELYQYAQQAADREAIVNVINQRIQQATTLDGVLQTAAEEIGRALDARETTIQLDAGITRSESPPVKGPGAPSAIAGAAEGKASNGQATARRRPEVDSGASQTSEP